MQRTRSRWKTPFSSLSRLSIPRVQRRKNRFKLPALILLCVILLADIVNIWPFAANPALAAPLIDSAQAEVTVDDFFEMGNPDQHERGDFVRPSKEADLPEPTPLSEDEQPTGEPLPSAEPAKMQGQAYLLDASFVINTPQATHSASTMAKSMPDGLKPQAVPADQKPLTFVGSDGRLDLEIPRGTFDLAQAKLSDGVAPMGELSLRIQQRHGHYISAQSVLGSYYLEIKDSQDHIVQGITLKHPITIRYHYQADELSRLNLSPSNIHLSWPESIHAAQTAKQSTAPYVVAMTNDPTTQTLSATVTTLGVGTMQASGPPSLELMPKPLTVSVGGNTGQLSYNYPIQVAPGIGGFAPQVAVSYSSQSINERHSPRTPANSVGEGWSLSLGSITAREYHWGDGATANGTIYSISGIGGVSERLLPDLTPDFYVTQKNAHLRIQKVNDCFRVWDRSGTYYELGCEQDARQYTTKADGTRKVYRWDVNKILLPTDIAQKRRMVVNYLQDKVTVDGHEHVRDAVLKQIRYGYDAPGGADQFDIVAGTVNFRYLAPFDDGWFTDPYSQQYKDTCRWPGGEAPIARCDNPVQFGTIKSPEVMSTFSLLEIVSYVGKDDSSGKRAYSYDFVFDDAPGGSCWVYPLIQQYCAGKHLLRKIIPYVYQNGPRIERKGMWFDYSEPLQVFYRDPAHTFPLDTNQKYTGQTWWRYLDNIRDLDTGYGSQIWYEQASSNAHGTPYIKNGSTIIDDRRNPLYCERNKNHSDSSKRCTGKYDHWNDYSWSTQVVTRIETKSKSSSSTNLSMAVTEYDYSLMTIEPPLHAPPGVNWNCNVEPTSNPDVNANPFLRKCTAHSWSPGTDGTPNPAPDRDWVNYYNSEFRGFEAVYITAPDGHLTEQHYFSTHGLWSGSHLRENYNAGQLISEKVYWSNTPNDTALIQETKNTYTGYGGTPNSCYGQLHAVYTPCLVRLLKSETRMHEGGFDDATPWLRHEYRYDDYNGGGVAHGYGNLLEEKLFGSNTNGNSAQPTLTKQWSYYTTTESKPGATTGDYLYIVDKVKSSKLIDDSGHVWQCSDVTYDEGRQAGYPTPSMGWVTTSSAYSNCNGQNGQPDVSTAIKSHTGYDIYGNAVATVDPFGVTHATAYERGNGQNFGQQGNSHLWGFKVGGDLAVGELRSQTVTLGDTGQVDFLVAGGNDLTRLSVTLVRASDNQVLFTETGHNNETYRRVTWNAAAHIGTSVYIKVVDTATDSWGHLNLDDVHIAGANLTNADFEQGNLSGWTVVSGTAFSAGAVITQSTATNGGQGCQPATAPAYLAGSWPTARQNFASCVFYDTNHYNGTLPYKQQNALRHETSSVYDRGQGYLPTTITDSNGQNTITSYNFTPPSSDVSITTVQVKAPGETGTYTNQSRAISTCKRDEVLPCYVVEKNTSLYPDAVSRTYYDRTGRTVETRTPLDANNDLISFVIYDEVNRTTFESVPFRYPRGTHWVDPAIATIDNGTIKPAGTIRAYDPLGRVRAVRGPAVGSSAEPGIDCDGLDEKWSSCTGHGNAAQAYGGDGKNYYYTYTIDANSHMAVSFQDVLGRERYVQWYRTRGSIGEEGLLSKRETQYNVLGKPTLVTMTDLAPQAGQEIMSVTTTTIYDDFGRVITLDDPSRGEHSYVYDENGRVIQELSGSRLVGTSYDLLGRTGCIQDNVPTTDGSGTCSSGSHPFVQYTYDISMFGSNGSTDFPKGNPTQTVTTTYYPDQNGNAYASSVQVIERMQYDLRDRMVATTLQVALPEIWEMAETLPLYKASLTYNNADQLTTMVTSTEPTGQGFTFTRVYDNATGMLTGLSNNATGVANLVTISYNQHGLPDQTVFKSLAGVDLAQETFTYDGNLLPASATASWLSGSGSTGVIFQNNRVYDPVGNVVSVSTTHAAIPGQNNSGGTETQNFCYDEFDRLTWAGNSGSQPAANNGTCGSATLTNTLDGASYTNSFVYNNLGQMWKGPLNGDNSSQQYLYCDSEHSYRLTGVYPQGTTCANRTNATASYSVNYDNWGNVTSRTHNGTTAELSYNVFDQLIQWDAGATDKEWYAYNAEGDRIIRKNVTATSSSITVYAFGLEEHVYDHTGIHLSDTYYYILSGRTVGIQSGADLYYILTDALGSVLATFSTVANTAVVRGNQVYGPYGHLRYSKGNMGTARGFTGQYSDTTGLQYYNARYYDPVVGRFLTADVIEGSHMGLDPYAYVNGNPETLSDPTGLESERDYHTAIWALEDSSWLVLRYGLFDWGARKHLDRTLGFISSVIPGFQVQVGVEQVAHAASRWIKGLVIVAIAVLIAYVAWQLSWFMWSKSNTKVYNSNDPSNRAASESKAKEIAKESKKAFEEKKLSPKEKSQTNYGGGYLEIAFEDGTVESYKESSFISTPKEHSEEQAVKWVKGILKVLKGKPIKYIKVLIYTFKEPCGPEYSNCAGKIDTGKWENDIASTAGVKRNKVSIEVWTSRGNTAGKARIFRWFPGTKERSK